VETQGYDCKAFHVVNASVEYKRGESDGEMSYNEFMAREVRDDLLYGVEVVQSTPASYASYRTIEFYNSRSEQYETYNANDNILQVSVQDIEASFRCCPKQLAFHESYDQSRVGFIKSTLLDRGVRHIKETTVQKLNETTTYRPIIVLDVI
jgi:hypothetical protein